MRRLDCVLEPTKDQVSELYNRYKDELVDPSPVITKQINIPFYNSSRFDMSRIKSDPQNVYANFINYLDGYSENVREITKHFSLKTTIDKLHENNRLYVLVDKFTEFDLHPNAIDNHQMGSIYEELLRRFSEMSNEESGDHYTPRDVVKLLVSVIFESADELKQQGLIRSIYDPCCGTGGMLTIAKQWILDNINPNLRIELFGQTLLDESYAICKSDFLILGENPQNIGGPRSTLSDDKFPEKKFDYMITNPPFGVSWKSDENFVRQESTDPCGRFNHGIPWVKDGQLLFLSHMVSKMEPKGSKIGLVTNGSPLTTGDGARGESQFRKYLVENDLIETILILPDDLFFNTGILCYLWVLNNNKPQKSKGKIKVVNCIDQYKKMYKPIGDKRKLIDQDNLQSILELLKAENLPDKKLVRIFDNSEFLYKYVTVHTKKKDTDGKPITNKSGQFVRESNLSEKIKIPLTVDTDNHVKTLNNAEDLFYDPNETIVGCEFHLTKYFYTPQKPAPLETSESQFQEILGEFLNQTETIFSSHRTSDQTAEHWFGPVSPAWEIVKIDQCFSLRTEKVDQKDYPPLSVTKNGVIPQLDHVAKSNESGNRSLVKKNDFVINSRSDRKGSCGVSIHEGSVSSVNTVLIPNLQLIHPEYIHGLFRTKEFQEEFYRFGKGIVDDLWTTSWSEMRDIFIPLPPLTEQKKIAEYLTKLEQIESSLIRLNQAFGPFEQALKSRYVFGGTGS